jgi:exoribonuclease R
VRQISEILLDGFRTIRAKAGVPESEEQSPEILALAREAAIDPKVRRSDKTQLELVTLDPQSSTDLDQAYAISQRGQTIVLHYAIADIGAFVPTGSLIEQQAWDRGVTVYCPDGSVPLYPRHLSKDRASLLPDGPRPAILLTVEIDPQGKSVLTLVERATVRSRAKLAYETVTTSQLGPLMIELSRRIDAAEFERGAFRVDRPEQHTEVDPTMPGGLRLAFAPKRASEQHNSALSLAANLAVADHFLRQGVGLFRVMDDPDESQMQRLRSMARALDITWADHQGLSSLIQQIQFDDPRHAQLASAIRRVGGGARYLNYPVPNDTPEQVKKNAGQIRRPWHSAIAASYAHATAPMRRLADRYVLDLLVAQFNDDVIACQHLIPLLDRLPEVMANAERRSALIERDCLELIEDYLLEPLIGTVLDATVTEVGKDNWQVLIENPAVIRRVQVANQPQAQVGHKIKVKVNKPQADLDSSKRGASAVGLTLV